MLRNFRCVQIGQVEPPQKNVMGLIQLEEVFLDSYGSGILLDIEWDTE